MSFTDKKDSFDPVIERPEACDDNRSDGATALCASIKLTEYRFEDQFAAVTRATDQFRETFERVHAASTFHVLNDDLSARISTLQTSIKLPEFRFEDQFAAVTRATDQFRETFERAHSASTFHLLNDDLSARISTLQTSIKLPEFRFEDQFAAVTRATDPFREIFERANAGSTFHLLNDNLSAGISTLQSALKVPEFQFDDQLVAVTRATDQFREIFERAKATSTTFRILDDEAVAFRTSIDDFIYRLDSEAPYFEIEEYTGLLDTLSEEDEVLGQLMTAATMAINQLAVEGPRLAAHAARELLSQYLHLLAPNASFSTAERARGHNGNPTRRMRVEAACFRIFNLSPNAKRVSDLCAEADELYSDLSAIAHSRQITDHDSPKFVGCFRRLMKFLASLN